MFTKIFINFALIIFLFVTQTALISGLPGYFNNFNLILIVLLFILGLGNVSLALWWGIVLGILLDMFSFLPFGIYLLSIMGSLFIINLFLNNFFTNRTLYSFLALIFFATIIYEFLVYLLSFLLQLILSEQFIPNMDLTFFQFELSKVILNTISVFVLYIFVSIISKGLKPVFLIKRT